MKTKTITVPIEIPADYKYLARQPWGEIILFKNKPSIYVGDSHSYWESQKDEFCLINNFELCPTNSFWMEQQSKTWKESLVELP